MYDPGVFLYKAYDFVPSRNPRSLDIHFVVLTNIKTYKNSIINYTKNLLCLIMLLYSVIVSTNHLSILKGWY